MLIGEEERPRAPRAGPLQNVARIGGSAHRSAVRSAKSFQVRLGIDIGDRHHVPLGGQALRQLPPGILDHQPVRFFRQRAKRVRLRQQNRLAGLGEDRRRFGHEMHAAEDDVFCFLIRGGRTRQLQRIAAVSANRITSSF